MTVEEKLKEYKVDVLVYAKLEFIQQQMEQIRLGLESKKTK